jgi:hypothetical protein
VVGRYLPGFPEALVSLFQLSSALIAKLQLIYPYLSQSLVYEVCSTVHTPQAEVRTMLLRSVSEPPEDRDHFWLSNRVCLTHRLPLQHSGEVRHRRAAERGARVRKRCTCEGRDPNGVRGASRFVKLFESCRSDGNVVTMGGPV